MNAHELKTSHSGKGKRNIKPFDGEKYSIWKYRVRALLEENYLFSVVDEEQNIVTVKIKNTQRQAKSIVVEYLSDSFLFHANNASKPKEIRELYEICERKSLALQVSLMLKLKGDTSLYIFLINQYTQY